MMKKPPTPDEREDYLNVARAMGHATACQDLTTGRTHREEDDLLVLGSSVASSYLVGLGLVDLEQEQAELPPPLMLACAQFVMMYMNEYQNTMKSPGTPGGWKGPVV